MPHVNIKHFPVPLSSEQKAQFASAITNAVVNALACDPGVVSIALEPVDAAFWNERVYVPEILNRSNLLCKQPSY